MRSEIGLSDKEAEKAFVMDRVNECCGRVIHDDPNPLEESAADLMEIIYSVKTS